MNLASAVEPELKLRFAGRTDRGMVREHNEDAYLLAPPYFIVADGMGGHARGEVAAQCVVEAFQPPSGLAWASSETVLDAVQAARTGIQALAAQGRPPGSTLAGIALSVPAGPPCWLVFNVGDSRTYLLRDGQLSQISVDHTAHQEGRDGVSRSVITRALGAGLAKPLVVDQWLIPVRQGDLVLICSDGLYTELTDMLIAAILLGEGDPQSKVDQLVAAARQAGGRDNVTAVVVVADEVSCPAPPPNLEDTLQADDTLPDVGCP